MKWTYKPRNKRHIIFKLKLNKYLQSCLHAKLYLKAQYLNQLNKITFSQKSLALNLSTNFDIELGSEQILVYLRRFEMVER
ncbi:hypothetical protein BpHYR1_028475 [Brachionus plicatilis]|uniref:Uncharacterized protein n=1 Tax=Brachionus plicatilis TaxID=10195 RepID=A0A3M7S1I1_BRAPC|nr:hypothetical protein BpHYR1_028475 [Brachionus plicatilis]